MADETVDTKKTAKGMGKYKWWIIGGGVGLVIIFLVMKSAGNSSTTATQAAASAADNIDPQTGYVAGSAADLAALGEGSSASETGSTGTTNNYYGTQSATTTTNPALLPNNVEGTPGWVGPPPVAFPIKTPAGAPVAAPSYLAGNTTGYTSNATDTLGSIAAANNVDVASLAAANSHALGSKGLVPGTRLTIPK
jgi:LysM repeat protein